MSMLRIELRNEAGKKVVHEQGFISGRRVRVALEMQDEFERNVDMSQTEQLDKMLEFVADTFDDNDVTVDAILDGTESKNLMNVLSGVIDEVMGKEKEQPKEVAKE
jgi:ribosomal protein S17E